MSGWLPDGMGLDPLSAEVAADTGATVHLRLSNGGEYPLVACVSEGERWRAWGQLWSGVASEVTCPACLEVVHA